MDFQLSQYFGYKISNKESLFKNFENLTHKFIVLQKKSC